MKNSSRRNVNAFNSQAKAKQTRDLIKNAKFTNAKRQVKKDILKGKIMEQLSNGDSSLLDTLREAVSSSMEDNSDN